MREIIGVHQFICGLRKKLILKDFFDDVAQKQNWNNFLNNTLVTTKQRPWDQSLNFKFNTEFLQVCHMYGSMYKVISLLTLTKQNKATKSGHF